MSELSNLAAQAWVRRHKRNGKPYGNYVGYYRFPDEPTGTQHKFPTQTRDKRIAESRLRAEIETQHAVREGLRPAPQQVAAVQRPLTEYVKQFVQQLRGEGQSRDYVRKFDERLPKLFTECGWVRAVDITAASFKAWRAEQVTAPKTRNDYLAAARQFVDWLVDLNVVELNPLRSVKPLRTAGKQSRPRRPLTGAEAERLIAATPCPRRRTLYLLAMTTGGRLGELTALRWADLDLDGERPGVVFRASTTKNSKASRIPLPAWAAAEVRAFRPAGVNPADRVFPQSVSHHSFDADLDRAGIAKQDDLGRAVSFHSLRHTYNQLLQESGVSLRHAQRLMRHSDPKLTANTYLDADRLDVDASLANFPQLSSVGGTPRSTPDTVRSTPEMVAERRGVSQDVAECVGAESTELPVNQEVCRPVSQFDTERRTPEKQWSRGESNPRPVTVSRTLLRVYSLV